MVVVVSVCSRVVCMCGVVCGVLCRVVLCVVVCCCVLCCVLLGIVVLVKHGMVGSICVRLSAVFVCVCYCVCDCVDSKRLRV